MPDTHRRRCLPMDAAEGCLPPALSLACQLPASPLASGRAGGCLDGDAAWSLLPWLLLDADGPVVCWRTDEPRLDRCDLGLSASGKDNSMGRTDEPADGGAPCRLGRQRLIENDLT